MSNLALWYLLVLAWWTAFQVYVVGRRVPSGFQVAALVFATVLGSLTMAIFLVTA